jgi:predicted dehydrogenase
VVVFHGFHYRYHPIFDRLLEVMTSGEIGTLQTVTVRMSMPAPADDDLRWSLPQAGGAMMDLGCYALHVMTTTADTLGGAAELLRAEATERRGRPGVDERFQVETRLPEGVAGKIHCNGQPGPARRSDRRDTSPDTVPDPPRRRVVNLELIDACYRAAGLALRPNATTTERHHPRRTDC